MYGMYIIFQYIYIYNVYMYICISLYRIHTHSNEHTYLIDCVYATYIIYTEVSTFFGDIQTMYRCDFPIHGLFQTIYIYTYIKPHCFKPPHMCVLIRQKNPVSKIAATFIPLNPWKNFSPAPSFWLERWLGALFWTQGLFSKSMA